MLTEHLSKKLKIKPARIINYREIFNSHITPDQVKSLKLNPGSRPTFYELVVEFKENIPLAYFAVEVHNPAEPFATITECPQDLSIYHTFEHTEKIRVARWKHLSAGWVGCSLPFKDYGQLAKDIDARAQLLKTILIERFSGNTSELMGLLNQYKDKAESSLELQSQLVDGLTVEEARALLLASSPKDTLYFRVFHYRVEGRIFLNAHLTLAGESFKYNKITHASFLQKQPLSTKGLV